MKKRGRPAKTKSEIIRYHYINEWSKCRGLTQADLTRETDADPGTVSRWFDGKVPTTPYLGKLAELFGTDISGLFQPPENDMLLKAMAKMTVDQRTALANVVTRMNSSDIETAIRLLSGLVATAA
ncbi:helix-turn-helix domain-containing protein [Agrobacterium vitis]|uniref:helix-turn-helix transcriptional regulator n=1 Tax=Agrobacterium vitis TaxID=373 RepID=UPI0012E81447|nr:helix-turn-helix domain-containing protein [Agrobacterium vitis]